MLILYCQQYAFSPEIPKGCQEICTCDKTKLEPRYLMKHQLAGYDEFAASKYKSNSQEKYYDVESLKIAPRAKCNEGEETEYCEINGEMRPPGYVQYRKQNSSYNWWY